MKVGFEMKPVCMVWGIPVNATINDWLERCDGFLVIDNFRTYGCRHRNGFECTNRALLDQHQEVK